MCSNIVYQGLAQFSFLVLMYFPGFVQKLQNEIPGLLSTIFLVFKD